VKESSTLAPVPSLTKPATSGENVAHGADALQRLEVIVLSADWTPPG